MSWIPMHQELIQHPKIYRLAKALGTSKFDAIGRLFALWSWAMNYADNGDITSFDAGFIADAMGWTGDPSTLIDAMKNCGDNSHSGFLEEKDGKLLIHDWDEYGGKLRDSRENGRRRQAQRRAKSKEETGLTPSKDEEKCNALRHGYVTEGCNGYVTEGGNGYVTQEIRLDKSRVDKKRVEDKRKDNKRRRTTTTTNAVSGPFKRRPEDTPELYGEEVTALRALTEMYELCPEYLPDPPEETYFVHELYKDYPDVPIVAEFHKAREWLSNQPAKKRKKLLRTFLRNWISNAVKQYTREEPYFVPA